MEIPNIVYDFLASNAVVGLIVGSAITVWGKGIKREAVLAWHAFCAFAHHAHIRQTTLDDRAIDLLDRARPAMNKAMDEARAGLVAERADAAAMETDQTPQTGSLMPVKVDAEPLAPVIAAAVVAAPATAPDSPAAIVATAVLAAP